MSARSDRPYGTTTDLTATTRRDAAKRDGGEDSGRYGQGDVLADRYRLEAVLGRGGMGYVWLARDTELDVEVALKLIRQATASHQATERLRTEARAVARLGHPSIVRLYDHGTTQHGDAFLAMELVEGEALVSVIERCGRLTCEQAARILLPIASALAAAHAKGIVHRDVKPDNVVLTSDDGGAIVPKLLDFGIAKLRDDERHSAATTAGVTLGSPAYMAPEQALGSTDVDARADVWALCVVFYEAVAGHRPFRGATYRAMMDAILRGDPLALTELGIGDDALWSIIERGLAKDRDDRWPSMRALGCELAGWLIDRGVDSDAAGTSLRSHWQRDESTDTNPALRIPSREEVSPMLALRVSMLGRDRVGTTIRRAAASRTRDIVFGGGALLLLGAVLAGVIVARKPEPDTLEPLGAPASLPDHLEASAPRAPSAPTASAPPAPSASAATTASATAPAAGPPSRPPRRPQPTRKPRPTPKTEGSGLPIPTTPDF